MIYLMVKLILWLALAFVLGAGLGWWLRRFNANAAQAEYAEQLQLLTDSRDSLATQLESKGQALRDSETTLDKAEQDLLNQTNEVLRVQRLYSQSGIKVAELEEESTQLSGQLVLEQDQVTKLQARQAELLAEHEAAVSDLLVERSTLQDKLSMADQDLAATTSRIGEFTTTQKTLEERVVQAETTSEQGVGKLQAKVAGLEQQHGKLKQQHLQQAAESKALDKSNMQLKAKVTSLLAELEQAQSSSARDAQQLTLRIDSLQSDLDVATELAQQRERELDANNEAVSNNDEQVRRLTADVRRWRSRIPDLQSELDEKESQVRERNSRLATLEERLLISSQRLQANQRVLMATKTNSTGTAQAQARIAQLLARLDTQQKSSLAVPVRKSQPAVDDKRPASFFDTRPAQVDDLKRIKGIGPKLEDLLQGLGIYQFAQIAKLTPTEVAWLDDRLNFKGRIARDAWIQQAQQFAG